MFNFEIQTAKIKISMCMSKDASYYHTVHHVSSMIQEYETRKDEFGLEHDINLRLAIYYHDIVYIPGATNNEEKSAEYAPNDEVKRLIMSTKVDFGYRFELLDEKILHTLDWSGFSNFDRLYSNHKKIFREAIDQQFVPLTVHSNQMKFYSRLLDALRNEGYKIDFFNEDNNTRAIENLERMLKVEF